MKTKIIISWATILFFAASLPAVAGDLYLEGLLSSGTYDSDAGIITRNSCLIDTGVNVAAIATFEIVIGPGMHIKTGGSFTARVKDNDGLSNPCEMLYFGHLNYSPTDDPDIDWLDNYAECTLGTIPNLYDMDNDDDEIPDWWEVKYFGYTLEKGPNEDSDGDGVVNYMEFKLGSNPAVVDLPGTGIHYEYDALGGIKRIYRIPAE
jgi:hypothetical protein